MKRLAQVPGLKLWTMLLMTGSMFSSCNILDETEEDCSVYVSFKYDMNMEFTNAFQQAVNSVTLYAFDKNGILAFQKTEEGELLKQDGYRMRLDEVNYSAQAEYDFITWAGEPNNKSFTIPILTVGKSTKEELICQLNRKHESRSGEVAVVDTDLQDLFHGQVSGLSFGRGAVATQQDVVVPLVKNTNSIRIVLQEVSGEALDVKDFNFRVTDKNGKMYYDNTLMEDELITYKAWHTGNGHAGLDEGQLVEGVTEINVAIAELTTSRLMADMEPILTITKIEDGSQVLSIPLVQAALLYKREKYSNMSNQEYLDREDEYNFTFFLQDGKWVSSSIIINSWRVILQNSDLK